MNFRIILTQFYINFSSYTPFHFSFTVPLSGRINYLGCVFLFKLLFTYFYSAGKLVLNLQKSLPAVMCGLIEGRDVCLLIRPRGNVSKGFPSICRPESKDLGEICPIPRKPLYFYSWITINWKTYFENGTRWLLIQFCIPESTR